MGDPNSKGLFIFNQIGPKIHAPSHTCKRLLLMLVQLVRDQPQRFLPLLRILGIPVPIGPQAGELPVLRDEPVPSQVIPIRHCSSSSESEFSS